jgi:hypothetical protein
MRTRRIVSKPIISPKSCCWIDDEKFNQSDPNHMLYLPKISTNRRSVLRVFKSVGRSWWANVF